MVKLVHHALDGEAFLHELLAAVAQALAQRPILRQLEQALTQAL